MREPGIHRKKLAVGALLLALFTWPLVHAGLVYFFDMNPWKFFGWAMYCVPPPGVRIELYEVRGDQLRPLPAAARTHDELEAQREYLKLRVDTGSIHPPDLIARHTFAAYPPVERLRIVVVHEIFDLDVGRITEHRYGYAYDKIP